MSTKTLGTNATTSLVAVKWLPGFNSGVAAADLATINNDIKDDQNVAHPKVPGAFSYNGQLFIPNRGVLKLLPGDWVAVDATTGWPILLSSYAIASGPWTHS